ncbi:hypothetical protein AeRB84_006009, partial [Aphanomyces euteiches]
MPTTVMDCILGVDYLRRVHAVIDLAHNELRIPGVSRPLPLIRHPSNGSPSTSDPTGQVASITVTPKKPETSGIAIENPTRLKANSLHMVCCALGDPIADGSDILVENLPGALAPRIACSLNTVRNGKLWIQVQNPTPNDIHLRPQTKIGFGTTLPDVYADGTDDPVPPKPPDPNPDESDNMPRNGDTVLTQQVYPGVIASVTDERLSSSRHGKDTRAEIPINWDGSSLDLLQRETIRKLLLEFDIFVTTSKAPGRTDRTKCTINTGNAAPIKSAPYRVSQREGELMEAEIRQYEDLGLIRLSTSPWASPVLMIRKPDGSIRFCIDYRKLNDVTIKDRYPMPRVDDLLDVVGKSKYFSTMDVASSYWNVRMEEESIPKTAFVCKFGLYEWLVMPFGLCNAVPQFERRMEDVLRDQLWMSCLVYLDDVIVFSPDFATHISRLRDVLTCLQSAGFKLKMSKCHWGKTSVAFLGHIVTPAGILPNPEKVKSVLRVRPLRNVAEVRAFLGLAGYFRRFI